MQQVVSRGTSIIAFVVGLFTVISGSLLAGHPVASDVSRIKDGVVWALFAVAALCAVAGLITMIRQLRSVGVGLSLAAVLVLAMTANAVAMSGSLSTQPQRFLSLVACVLAIMGATMAALDGVSSRKQAHESSRL